MYDTTSNLRAKRAGKMIVVWVHEKMRDFEEYSIFRGRSKTFSLNLQDFLRPKGFSRTFQILKFSRKKSPFSRRRGYSGFSCGKIFIANFFTHAAYGICSMRISRTTPSIFYTQHMAGDAPRHALSHTAPLHIWIWCASILQKA